MTTAWHPIAIYQRTPVGLTMPAILNRRYYEARIV